MALTKDTEGVTHLPDFFDGGTICGRSLSEMVEFINPPHDDPTCAKCGADPYEECPIYQQHGACSCSTGVPGNVCPLDEGGEVTDAE